MTTYCLSFQLETPLVRPSMPIHIESALLYAAIFSGMPETEAQTYLDAAIPFNGDRESGCYEASAILFTPTLTFTRFVTRHFSVDDYSRDIARGVVNARPASMVNLQSGPIRARLDHFPMLWATGGSAWLNILDLDAFGELVHCFTHVGKHTANGFGRLKILPTGRRYSLTHADDPNAWQRRILPFPVDGAEPIRATVRPPYWDRRNQQDAYMHPSLISGDHGVFA